MERILVLPIHVFFGGGLLGDVFKILVEFDLFFEGYRSKTKQAASRTQSKSVSKCDFVEGPAIRLCFNFHFCPIQVTFQALAALNRPLGMLCQRAECAAMGKSTFGVCFFKTNRKLAGS